MSHMSPSEVGQFRTQVKGTVLHPHRTPITTRRAASGTARSIAGLQSSRACSSDDDVAACHSVWPPTEPADLRPAGRGPQLRWLRGVANDGLMIDLSPPQRRYRFDPGGRRARGAAGARPWGALDAATQGARPGSHWRFRQYDPAWQG